MLTDFALSVVDSWTQEAGSLQSELGEVSITLFLSSDVVMFVKYS